MPDNNYSPVPPRPTEFRNGITTEYNGFTISDRFVVSKDGKFFTECISLQQAKSIIDQSNAQKLKQMPDKQKMLGKLWGSCELENGSEQRARETEQVNNYFENLLHESES